MRCKVRVTSTVSFEAECVGVSYSDIKNLARKGFNLSNKTPNELDCEVEIIKVIEEKEKP